MLAVVRGAVGGCGENGRRLESGERGSGERNAERPVGTGRGLGADDRGARKHIARDRLS